MSKSDPGRPERSSSRGADHAALIEEFWRRMNTNDFSYAAQLCSEQLVVEWPQSGERILGRRNFALINEQYPAHGPWRFTVRRVVSDERGGVSDVEVTDGAVDAQAVTFFEIEDGEISRMVEYWPEPFEPADWRVEWTERVDGPPGRVD